MLLDDLIRFMVHVKALGTEELFSFRKANGDRVCLTGMSVREEVKSTGALYGLDPECFSSHSLRKGGITHRGQRRLRPEFSGRELDLRPAFRIQGGRKPTVTDIKRLQPARRRSL